MPSEFVFSHIMARRSLIRKMGPTPKVLNFIFSLILMAFLI
jgi:hypothetical protein